MKQYILNEETWKLFMLALNKAPYEMVVPVLNKIKTEVKLINTPQSSTEVKNEQETTGTEVNSTN